MGLLDRAVLVELLDDHLAGLDLLHPRIGDPLDVVVAHLALEHALGVADAVEAEMADIGLGRDEGHRHLVADLAPAQLGIEDEGELVGRPEAGGALHGADDDRPRVLGEVLEGVLGGDRVVDVADRLRVAVGAEALDLVEGELGAGGDHQVVVVDRAAVLELDAVFLRMHPLGALRQVADVLALHHRVEVDLDILALAPAHRHPGIGRHEMVARPLADDGEVVPLAQLRDQFVGHDGAAQAGPQHHNLCHDVFS